MGILKGILYGSSLEGLPYGNPYRNPLEEIPKGIFY